MQYDEVLALRATGALLFFPEGRTYSPPAEGGRWYPSRWSGSCALRGGCGCCGSRMDNATLLRNCCHCPRSWRSALRKDCRTFLCGNVCQLPSKNFPRKIFDVYGYRSGDPHFLFAKKKQKRGRRDGENEWRFIIWKQR